MKRMAGSFGNFAIPSHVAKRRKVSIPLMEPKHSGVIVNKIKNNYMGVYFCNGKMRYVTEGDVYERVVHAVRLDANQMRALGHSVPDNVGVEKPKRKVTICNCRYLWTE